MKPHLPNQSDDRPEGVLVNCCPRQLMRILFVLILAVVSVAARADAATCTSIGTGNWDAAATWTCVGFPAATIPGAADNAVIANANPPHVVTVNVDSAALSLTFTGGNRAATVQLDPGITLNVTGAVTINAPTSNFANRAKILNVGAGILNAASITIANGTNTNAAQVTVSTGIITTSGSITFGGVNSDLISTGASMINIGGNLGSGGTLTTTNTGIINFNGSALQTIGLYTTYNNIQINNTAGGVRFTAGTTTINGTLAVSTGTLDVRGVTLNVLGATTVDSTISFTTSGVGAKTFTGPVTINTGGSWTNSSNEAITYGGGITNNGSFAWGTGIQTVSGGDVTFAGTAWTTGTGSFTFTGGGQQIVCDGTHGFTIPTLTVNNTVTNNCTGGLTVSTTLAGNSTLTQAADSILNIGDTAVAATLILTADAANNTVNYNRAGNQTVDTPSGAPATYFHLTLSGSGVKTMPAAVMTVLGNFTMSGAAGTSATAGEALTVGGDFTIGAGNTFSASTFSHSVAGNFTTNGTFNADTGTLTFNGTAAQAIGGTSVSTFNNLTISNTNAAVSATTSFDTTGTLNMNGGTTVLTPVAAVVVGGAGTLTGTGTVQVTLTGSGSDFSNQYTIAAKTLTNLTVEYTGAAAQAVSAITYGHLKINDGSGAALAGTATVDGVLTLTSGTFAVGANTLILNGPAIAGTPTNLGTTSSSNLTFGGSSAGVQVPGSVTALNNLTIDNVNGLTLNSSPSLSGVLTLTNGVVTTNGYVLDVTSDCSAAGIIIRTNGRVAGNVRLHYPTLNPGTTTCIFPIGDAANYTPVTIAMINVTSSLANSSLTVRTDPGQHADIPACLAGIDTARYVNRRWTMTPGGALTFGSYNVTLSFVGGDIMGGAAFGNFIIERKNGGVWTRPAMGAKNAADTTATGITQADGFGEFAIGEVAMPNLTIVKLYTPFEDEVNGTTDPKAIPGALIQYTVKIINNGCGAIDNNTITAVDAVPANMTMYAQDDGTHGTPVTFTCSAGPPVCGLTGTYPGDVTYKNSLGNPYTPTQPFDPNVKSVTIAPKGIMNGTSGAATEFDIKYLMKIN